MLIRSFITLVSVCTAASVLAAASDADIAKLGTQLTAVGAEPGANANGRIPAFNGQKMTPPAGWQAGAKPVNPYAGEKPLYVIDASNAEQYKSQLSEGQLTMLKSIAGYTMEVYPTHRDCGYPDFVAGQSKKNASVAKLNATDGLEMAVGGGIPFPLPQTGAEAIWNHKMRYNGVSANNTNIVVFPPKGSTGKEFGEVQAFYDEFYTPMGNPAVNSPSDVDGVEFALRERTLAPSSIAGDGVSGIYYLTKPTEANLYFSAQRRARRAPTYQYDAPILNTDNLAAVDQTWMFNGVLDRYDFKLVGKRELLIPYNNFALFDHTLSPEDVFSSQSIQRDKVRYELHRVWEVQATVKAGKRHAMPKRTFFQDEDTWAIGVADAYDAGGKLWRSQEAYSAPEYSLGACYMFGNSLFDVQAGRYLANTIAGSGKAVNFNAERKLNEFTAAAFSRWIGR